LLSFSVAAENFSEIQVLLNALDQILCVFSSMKLVTLGEIQ